MSFDFIKIFSFLALVLLLFSSCRLGQKTEGESPSPTPFVAEELKSEIPFSTKEPEIFQTEIVTAANGAERAYFLARNGANRRFDYNFRGKTQISVLQTDKNYLVFPDKKIFAENDGGENAPVSESWTDFITTEWLNRRTQTAFEPLGTENNLTKYRVLFEESDLSESIIYIDETKNLLVRQEFYSATGDQRTLNYVVEMRNTKLQTDEDVFAIPKDFRLVPIAEFRKISRAAQP
ncbi:MAG: hypothetical protein JWN60_898 [Acidobacteria bacterium]|nr:hypothetical protein [Acidobacteriota bacterium]